ncbi:putative phospholipid ABC transporter-binding protein MlaB [Arsenophonus endosymbiont of Aleurodicus floccissimus]|uniref:lipid asymmetry maintenance protein MlaB n=1 Tax=Arsenophonus endosymbiont of Aleurodicus floccissimus TaxID=2152761 RepID=UPI000E6AEC22|nr:lipid asymmetry maintenance protein MlaB [Arsenophonus endosymbiont of Aleurodicus floccissimus]SPP31891.1 putative phospholipid ABC transporter-binding protein MlaB [Arsenophonus endosymbiont of Aleurodicus floccissimus]
MIPMLTWEQKGQMLILTGELDRDTLPAFWQQRNQLLKGINAINVSQLFHIDSTGLAMFIRLKSEQQSENEWVFEGISERFKTLIRLYKLEDFMN